MKNTIKSIVAVFIAPVVLVVCFQANQIKTNEVKRGPALETKELTLKQSVELYLRNNAR